MFMVGSCIYTDPGTEPDPPRPQMSVNVNLASMIIVPGRCHMADLR